MIAGVPWGSASWACRTCSSSSTWLSTHPRRSGSLPGSPRRSTTGPCGRVASWPASTGRTLRSATRVQPRDSCSSTCGTSSPRTRRVGLSCVNGSVSTGCATRCWWRLHPPPPSRPSPAATSASNRRCPICSSARRCLASSCKSIATWCANCSSAACGARPWPIGSRWPKAPCRTSQRSPQTFAWSIAQRGNCPNGPSSTWPQHVAPSSTRASR